MRNSCYEKRLLRKFMSYLIFAWLAAFFYGLVNVSGKLTSKYAIRNIWLFNFLYGLFTVLFTLPLALKNGVGMPTTWENLTLSAIFNTLFSIFYVLAIYNLDVSVIGPLFNFRTAFGAILGVLILKESLTITQTILIMTIFTGGVFVSLDEKFSFKSFFQRSILYGILMSLFLALDSIFINKSVADTGYWQTNLFNPLISQAFLLLTIPLFYKEIVSIKIKQVTGTAIMAFCVAVGNIFANRAYATNVSLSTAIIALPISLFIVFALSIFSPDLLEKHTFKVYAIRFTAAFLMIGAALKISG